MSTKKKVLSLRIVLGALVALVLFLGTLTVVNYQKINRLETQVDNLKTVNQSLSDSEVSEYVVLNFIDFDGSITPHLVKKSLNISIYDYLLTLPSFDDSDFNSFDEKNYYFAALSATEYVQTEVLELKDNKDYYTTDEWGSFLSVGLQAIKLDRNYTVKRSLY